MDRCEAKRKEWANHWQCDEEVQNLEDKPWKHEMACTSAKEDGPSSVTPLCGLETRPHDAFVSAVTSAAANTSKSLPGHNITMKIGEDRLAV